MVTQAINSASTAEAEDRCQLVRTFRENGFVAVAPGHGLISPAAWDRFVENTHPSNCEYESYDRRDGTGVWMRVARFMLDIPQPEPTTHRRADEMLEILLNPSLMKLYGDLIGGRAVPRRSQAH